MTKFSTIASMLAAAVCTSVLFPMTAQAQSNAEGELTTQGLSTGEEVDTSRQPGDTYIKEEIGDWAIRCVVRESGEDPCQLYQLLADDNGVPIAEYTLFRLPDGQQAVAGATITVPLETALQEQLLITVDEENGKRYPFAFCNAVGCFARIGLTAEDIEAYKRGNQATLTITPAAAPDQRVNVTLSLTGFTAAIASPLILSQ